MRALVVYESMYGNTHAIADHIGEGLRSRFDVTVLPVAAVSAEQVRAADLLVVGGPTHAHGLSTEATRRAAAEAAGKDGLSRDPSATGSGLRDWLAGIPAGSAGGAAVFDTRLRAPAVFTGAASRGTGRRLGRAGYELVAPPESFFVDRRNRLLDGEAERASAWGSAVAESFTAAREVAHG
jgi:hypothetical protein